MPFEAQRYDFFSSQPRISCFHCLKNAFSELLSAMLLLFESAPQSKIMRTVVRVGMNHSPLPDAPQRGFLATNKEVNYC